jgi:hypothetical protein
VGERNVVIITSTYHAAEMKCDTKRGIETQKPACVIHYNKWMGEVDFNSVALVHKRTIPYRTTAAVGEVSAKFRGQIYILYRAQSLILGFQLITSGNRVILRRISRNI